ncbi:MAG: DotU family type IV/VI secretion system protein [Gemmatimonadota bacterium]|nr:DotU family type IV/VI secretion system protein [Gemmatimonadota bacterium]
MSVSSLAAPGRLAIALQEFITAVVRLRANHQPVTDAMAFRAQVTSMLARAEQDAISFGFSAQDARLAIFAVVAFLDESVLNLHSPAFSEWARRPLQDELFGAHMGGEWVFQHIEQLLARGDSPELADLLEVHQLCLLLGFHGKYGSIENGQLHAITARVGERLARLRGAPGDLAPAWPPPADSVETRDPWLLRLAYAAAGSVVLLFVLWGSYAFSLRSTTNGIRALAPVSAIAPVGR